MSRFARCQLVNQLVLAKISSNLTIIVGLILLASHQFATGFGAEIRSKKEKGQKGHCPGPGIKETFKGTALRLKTDKVLDTEFVYHNYELLHQSRQLTQLFNQIYS